MVCRQLARCKKIPTAALATQILALQVHDQAAGANANRRVGIVQQLLAAATARPTTSRQSSRLTAFESASG